jgi:DNA-binding MarR family transcriptional regulator
VKKSGRRERHQEIRSGDVDPDQKHTVTTVYNKLRSKNKFKLLKWLSLEEFIVLEYLVQYDDLYRKRYVDSGFREVMPAEMAGVIGISKLKQTIILQKLQYKGLIDISDIGSNPIRRLVVIWYHAILDLFKGNDTSLRWLVAQKKKNADYDRREREYQRRLDAAKLNLN